MTVSIGSPEGNNGVAAPSSPRSHGEWGRVGEDETNGEWRHNVENRLKLERDSKVEVEGNSEVENNDEVEIENAALHVIRGLPNGSPKKGLESSSGDAEPTALNRSRQKSWSFGNLQDGFKLEKENDSLQNSIFPNPGMFNPSLSPSRKLRNGEVESGASTPSVLESPLPQGSPKWQGSPRPHGSPLRDGSPMPQGSPFRHGSPMMKKLLTPSISFARIEGEMEEKSRMVSSIEELELKDGIKLPLIGEVRWEDLKRHAVVWLRNPKNLALLVWIIAVAVSGAILFMVMVGMLNAVLPKKSDRDLWFEISNQILNALFTLMALYNHPIRILHLVYLIRYNPTDIIRLRRNYCKNGLRKPHEWAHILVVVLLLHLNCIAQYCLCGLNWGYRRANRPPIGVAITLLLSFGAAAAAGIYNSLSPLGRDYFTGVDEASVPDEVDLITDKMERAESTGHSSSNHPSLLKLHNPKYKLLEKSKSFASREGKLVPNPEWEGGLFDCHNEPTISVLSVVCFPCVMGFNYERLGFGNRYVHIVTFFLLLGAPYMVFNLAAINIDNAYVRTSLGGTGIVLCAFSLLYGGFWRIRIRERYNLPTYTWCCKKSNTSDCFLWLFCCFCSLCQEVRTAEAYDVRNDKFFFRSLGRPYTPGSSPDHGIQNNRVPVPASHLLPLPSFPMVTIEDQNLSPGNESVRQMQDRRINSTILSPPPGQSIDRPPDPQNP